jgi:hypothetical protein
LRHDFIVAVSGGAYIRCCAVLALFDRQVRRVQKPATRQLNLEPPCGRKRLSITRQQGDRQRS